MNGVIRTRVGYAGGSKKNPEYYSLGDHTEVFQVEFDPEKISYRDLLKLFWQGHNPGRRPYSTQYQPIILYRGDRQKRLAKESLETVRKSLGDGVYTRVKALDVFYPAEDYHQKYYLRQAAPLIRDFSAMYPQAEDLMNSRAAAKVNGFAAGYGDAAWLKKNGADLGLEPDALAWLTVKMH